jgi:hypothetical protein
MMVDIYQSITKAKLPFAYVIKHWHEDMGVWRYSSTILGLGTSWRVSCQLHECIVLHKRHLFFSNFLEDKQAYRFKSFIKL